MIKNVDNISQFLVWLDRYNNQYLFSFVSLVSSLYKIKELCYKDIFIKKASELLLIPDQELLCGEIAILGHTPMKRYGEPSELIGATLWLASDASGFVTGAKIAIDGGFGCMTI